MILLIVIPIALVLLVIFWARNVSLYRKNFAYGIGILNQSLVHTYNVLNAPPNYKPLDLSLNFFDFTANLILKFVHFVIFSVVTYVFRNVSAVGVVLIVIYMIFNLLAWFTYSGRRAFYREIPTDYTSVFAPILQASISIPLYQTFILFLLMLV